MKFYDLSIPLDFSGKQVNLYGVEKAISKPFEGFGFIGDVRQGGSCNFESITFTPHCNSTHTECVGHISHERYFLPQVSIPPICDALLISIEPEKFGQSDESYLDIAHEDDLVISEKSIKISFEKFDLNKSIDALIIRTLPNNDSKKVAQYLDNSIYFTFEAIDLINQLKFTHLLCDLPSLDRLRDEGKMPNHRKYWGIELNSNTINHELSHKTITEMIYVENKVSDGFYKLSLQVSSLLTDASPSRPLIF